jgi:hypothetical protein
MISTQLWLVYIPRYPPTQVAETHGDQFDEDVLIAFLENTEAKCETDSSSLAR